MVGLCKMTPRENNRFFFNFLAYNRLIGYQRAKYFKFLTIYSEYALNLKKQDDTFHTNHLELELRKALLF